MFSENLKEKYGYDTPIFTEEILSLFPQYSRAYVFRLIKTAENEENLIKIDTGVYYLPQMTPFGRSTITASDVARKRYIQSDGEIYGIYSGISLQNAFSLTTQMTNTPEIVTNREATRRRLIYIDGMGFILRKARTEITSKNADTYRVLELFTEISGEQINDTVKKTVSEFLKTKNINRTMLLGMARSFPGRTLNNLVYSGVI